MLNVTYLSFSALWDMLNAIWFLLYAHINAIYFYATFFFLLYAICYVLYTFSHCMMFLGDASRNFFIPCVRFNFCVQCVLPAHFENFWADLIICECSKLALKIHESNSYMFISAENFWNRLMLLCWKFLSRTHIYIFFSVLKIQDKLLMNLDFCETVL